MGNALKLFETYDGQRYGGLVLASIFVVAAVLMPAPKSQAEAVDVSIYKIQPESPQKLSCILMRSEAHVPLPKVEQLPLYDSETEVDFTALLLNASVLEDAYFRGTLTASLSNLQALIPETRGKSRDEAFAKIRDANRLAAKAVAGDCLPEGSFVDQYQFHKTGLAKSYVMEQISSAHLKARQDATPFQNIRR